MLGTPDIFEHCNYFIYYMKVFFMIWKETQEFIIAALAAIRLVRKKFIF